MRREDLDLALEWARLEGWNPGLKDGEAFYAADPDGFLIGEVNAQPASVISTVRYGSDFAFLGFYICAPELRGQGHGWSLWQYAMQVLDGRTVGLDGVVDQQENYRRSGFKLAHRNIRFGGTVDLEPPKDARLCSLTGPVFDSVARYDQTHFHFDRQDFLRQWLRTDRPDRHSLMLDRDGHIEGLGTIRACHEGHKIGPIFARSEQDADLLFRALCAHVGPTTVFLDPPEPNQAACRLAVRYGLAPVFETARMYRGLAPDLPLQQIWGMTTFELG